VACLSWGHDQWLCLALEGRSDIALLQILLCLGHIFIGHQSNLAHDQYSSTDLQDLQSTPLEKRSLAESDNSLNELPGSIRVIFLKEIISVVIVDIPVFRSFSAKEL
jgi:hypothetical protein